MRVLVTGGAGFIGSTLVDRLLVEGHHVEVLDDLSTGSLANLADAREQARVDGGGRLKIHQGDVTDDAVIDLLAHRAPEVVVHLAGATAKADRSTTGQADVAIGGAVRVLEGARRAGSRKVVCVASARAQADPVRGIPDRAVHEYLGAYAEVHDLASTTLVASTVYGPRQTRATESSVVAVLVRRVLAGDACVLHDDGRARRDLLHVDDLVDAVVRSLATGDGETVEVGTGSLTTIAELQQAVAAVVGVDVPVVSGPRREGEPGTVAVDPRRAATVLGWGSWTALEDGLAHTVDGVRAVD